jgi:hypothetical protein
MVFSPFRERALPGEVPLVHRSGGQDLRTGGSAEISRSMDCDGCSRLINDFLVRWIPTADRDDGDDYL